MGGHLAHLGLSYDDLSHLADTLKPQPVHVGASGLGVEDGNGQDIWVREPASSPGPAQQSHPVVVAPHQCRHDNAQLLGL